VAVGGGAAGVYGAGVLLAGGVADVELTGGD
jgi:hypothetical protein